MYLLTPFVDGGELFEWVKDNGASEEEVVKPLFRQIVDGLRVRQETPRGPAKRGRIILNVLLSPVLSCRCFVEGGVGSNGCAKASLELKSIRAPAVFGG